MSEDLFLIGYETSNKLQLGLVSNGQAYALTDPELSLHQLLTQYSASEVVPQLLSLKGHAINPKVWGLPAARAPVWAAGITYEAIKESQDEKSPYSSIYINVYSAPRPELFFKSMPYDIVTGGEAVGIRSDSQCTLPGPELVALLNNRLEVIGFSIGNDMSSSDLQADNPLYLSQAKVYTGACAIGPRIWLQPGRDTWPELSIQMVIKRGDDTIFGGETSTGRMYRSLPELVDYLGRCNRFPHGVYLLTGSGIPMPDGLSVVSGDEVRIQIEPIGKLVNTAQVVGNQ